MAEIRLDRINFRHSLQEKTGSLADIVRPLTGNEDGFAFQDFCLTVPDGQKTALLGPSGCGKSTLLRIMAGLLNPDSGVVLYDGVDVNHIPPAERYIGMVFQDYALYPGEKARTNILSWFRFTRKDEFGDDSRMQKRLKETAEILSVPVEHLYDKLPGQLSGGEKQRVAIGRCVCRDPKLFFLDEPFSNLDAALRRQYRVQLKKLLTHFNITTVYVTHDQQEAALLADRIIVINEGKIIQEGTYRELLDHPVNSFVKEFIRPPEAIPGIDI